ncbi:hypothetical protein PYCC9005_000974 [Savitreella phatthalungensis]
MANSRSISTQAWTALTRSTIRASQLPCSTFASHCRTVTNNARGEKTNVDSRTQQIRDTLFGNKTPLKLEFANEAERLQHDTIHRAWLLWQRRQRERRTGDLRKAYDRMEAACEDLAQHSPQLFKSAMRKDKKRGFPLEIKAMTETPSTSGWNSAWTAPVEDA